MAQLRSAAVVAQAVDDLGPRPTTEEQIARWVGEDETEPAYWQRGGPSWRQVAAFQRWLIARRARERGVPYEEALRVWSGGAHAA